MMASAVNAAAVRPAASWPPACAAGRCEQGRGGQAQRERRQADERRQSAPDDEENADEINVRKTSWLGHEQSRARVRCSDLRGRRSDRDADLDTDRFGVRRADAETEAGAVGDAGGTERRTGWRTMNRRCRSSRRTAPSRFRRGRRSACTCREAAPRAGTTVPADASRRDSDTSVVSTSVPRASPRNPSRTRSTKWPTDGKSIAISSAKQSCSRLAGFDDRHTPGNGWDRKESRLTAKPG